MSISKRLKFIADLVCAGPVAADIGTDHAIVPVYLLKEDRVGKVIAVDLSRECIKKAQDAAIRHHLEEQLEARLSDGLEKISPGEVSSIVISGMGGILMTQILESGLDVVLETKELILSPHRDADLVREFLENNDLEIVLDEVIEDKKKKYCVIKAVNKRFFLKETT